MTNYEVKFNGDGTVTVTREYYDDLVDDSMFLNCLRNAGVDNWEGYEYACEEFNSEGDDDE